MSFEVVLRDVALEDLQEVPRNMRARIMRAVEKRLKTEPARYGMRLRQSLSGLWKMRVGDYRVVYDLTGQTVTVWAVLHRKSVYREAEKRLRRSR